MTVLVATALIAGAGVYIVLTRRDIVVILMGVELMLAAANIWLVASGAASGHEGASIGSVGLVILVVAAAEVACALAVLLALFRRSGRSTTDALEEVRG